MQRKIAWLGTALKSSQPSRNAWRRSDRSKDLRTGPVAPSRAAPTGDGTLPWYDVAMIVSSLATAVSFAPRARRWRPPLERSRFWPDANRSWPAANLSTNSTPKRDTCGSTLGEYFLRRNANVQTTQRASFRRHFAAAKLESVG